LIQSLKPVFKNHEKFDEEYECFDTFTEYFFHDIEENFETNPMHYTILKHNETQKIQKKQKNNKNQKNNCSIHPAHCHTSI
jgi:hypothetical protein